MEYEIPEAAQLALEQMNSVMLGGRNIKVSLSPTPPLSPSMTPPSHLLTSSCSASVPPSQYGSLRLASQVSVWTFGGVPYISFLTLLLSFHTPHRWQRKTDEVWFQLSVSFFFVWCCFINLSCSLFSPMFVKGRVLGSKIVSSTSIMFLTFSLAYNQNNRS